MHIRGYRITATITSVTYKVFLHNILSSKLNIYMCPIDAFTNLKQNARHGRFANAGGRVFESRFGYSEDYEACMINSWTFVAILLYTY